MKYRKVLLLLISLLSYGWIIGWKLLFLVGLAMCVWATDQMANKSIRKWMTAFVMTIFVCGFFLFRDVQYSTMLIGYSVFAFTSISYLIDQYRCKVSYDMCETLLYLFFFPKMLAGPIVRASEFIPQLSHKRENKCKDTYLGVKLLIFGMFVKYFLSDGFLANENGSQGIDFMLRTFVWGIRFYFDFYAYSVIAVGLGLMCGISLPMNFDRPYRAKSFRDFWKRWNITLSSWLRDYVYISLGGSRCSRWRSLWNVIITFLISGLWHGIAFPFLLWGVFHGILVCIERSFLSRLKKEQYKRHLRGLSCLLVAMITMLLWQLFRCSDITDVNLLFRSAVSSCDCSLPSFLSAFMALSLLWLIDCKWMRCIVYEMPFSSKGIITEVTVISLMLIILLLCPFQYTFDFFYFRF